MLDLSNTFLFINPQICNLFIVDKMYLFVYTKREKQIDNSPHPPHESSGKPAKQIVARPCQYGRGQGFSQIGAEDKSEKRNKK